MFNSDSKCPMHNTPTPYRQTLADHKCKYMLLSCHVMLFLLFHVMSCKYVMSRHVMYYALHAMLPESQQCHRRARTSYRLADLVTADRRTAASLAACAALCANRASCNSLSYR